MSMTPFPQVSFATRLIRIAKERGLIDKGSVVIPMHSYDGRGSVSIVVGFDRPAVAPVGTIMVDASTNSFARMDDSASWADLGPDISQEALDEMLLVPTAPVAVMPLPKPVDPNAEDLSHITEVVVSYNETAHESMRSDDTHLAHPRGYSAQHMVCASNGEIALAGAVRYTAVDAADIVPAAGSYDLNVATSSNALPRSWYIVIGAALLPNSVQLDISATYSITLRVLNTETGKHVDLALDTTDGTVSFYDPRTNVRLSDVAYDESFGFVIGAEAIDLLAARLHSSISPVSNTAIGSYNFTLAATRRRGDVPTVVCAWSADVEDDDTSFIINPVVRTGARPNAKALKPDGNMLHGTGNTANSMIVATNGEIELAGAARYFRSNTLTPVTGSNYAINVNDSPFTQQRTWSWLYALTMVNTANSANIASLYDVTMTVTSEFGSLAFNGRWTDDGVFHFENLEHGLDIVDNTVDGVGSIVQNIQRVQFYVDQLNPKISHNAKTPVGDYTIELRAVRKVGSLPPVVCFWTVAAIDDNKAILVPPTQTAGTVPNMLARNPTNPTRLRHGTGNHAANITVASNGELELGGTCCLHRMSGPGPVPTVEQDGTALYTIFLEDSTREEKNWTWTYLATLFNSTNGAGVDDLYDVTMSVTHGAETLTFSGSFVDGVYHFAAPEYDLDIIDNTVDTTGAVVQNIQRVVFYSDQIKPTIGETYGSPVGRYDFELVATRKLGTVPVLKCLWSAQIAESRPPVTPPPAPQPEPESEVEGADEPVTEISTPDQPQQD